MLKPFDPLFRNKGAGTLIAIFFLLTFFLSFSKFRLSEVTFINLAFTSAGGTGSIAVAIPAGCTWTAQSQAPWITITSSMPRAGDNPVAFVVAANSGPARTGRITVRDRVVVITQAGQ